MKQQELNENEKQEINGGSNSFSTSSEISIGSDSLLSITYHQKNGDKEKTYTLVAGKDVDINLGV